MDFYEICYKIFFPCCRYATSPTAVLPTGLFPAQPRCPAPPAQPGGLCPCAGGGRKQHGQNRPQPWWVRRCALRLTPVLLLTGNL